MADYSLFNRFLTELANGSTTDMGQWSIKIPAGFTVSKDKNATGGFCLVAISNDGSTDISAPSEATIGMNVQVGHCPLRGTSINLLQEQHRKIAQKIVFDQVRGWWEENVAVNDVMFSVYKYVCYQIFEIDNCCKFKCCVFDGDDLFLMSIFFNTEVSLTHGKDYQKYEGLCVGWLETIEFQNEEVKKAEPKAVDSCIHSSDTIHSKEEISSWAKNCIKILDEKDYEISEDGIFKKYKGTYTKLILPDGIKAISGNAFPNTLEAIVIPEGVTTIRLAAFSECKNLSSVMLPSTLAKIEVSAFYGCKSLTSVTIPEGVEEISSNAFRDCSKLADVYIPASVKSIGKDAFKKVKKDQKIVLTIHAPAGSFAARFAEEEGLPLELI